MRFGVPRKFSIILVYFLEKPFIFREPSQIFVEKVPFSKINAFIFFRNFKFEGFTGITTDTPL